MGKSKSKSSESGPTVAKKIDPAIASLFESSLGVVKAPERKIPTPPEKKPHSPAEDESDEESDDQGDDEELSEVDGDGDGDVDMVPDETEDDSGRSRKRKRKAVEEEIEDTYMRKLQDEEEPKPKSKKAKQSAVEEASPEGKEDSDNSDSEDYGEREEAPKTEFPIKHETLVSAADVELDKSARSVFLGNVPSNAISSKSDYKKLKAFFATVGKISSIRFRSIAFSEQIPRKAAFVNHKLHEKQKTVNAYIVYKDAASAREALKLNGSVVLDRHIRVDSVAHPGQQDPKRCVFVGNLDFEAQEENLWKHFGTCGKVEYVRIVRDAKTNVGKGFAYVQFEDAMSVDQALLLDGKKMEGDRKLRVTRAKTIKRNQKPQKPGERQQRRPASKTPGGGKGFVPKVDPKTQATLGRAQKLLGRAGASQLKKQVEVFEGMRATADTDSGIKKGGTGKKKGGKARARTTARSTAWKKKKD